MPLKTGIALVHERAPPPPAAQSELQSLLPPPPTHTAEMEDTPSKTIALDDDSKRHEPLGPLTTQPIVGGKGGIGGLGRLGGNGDGGSGGGLGGTVQLVPVHPAKHRHTHAVPLYSSRSPPGGMHAGGCVVSLLDDDCAATCAVRFAIVACCAASCAVRFATCAGSAATPVAAAVGLAVKSTMTTPEPPS